MAKYERSIDYCADDSVKVLPKYHSDYVPGEPATTDPVKIEAKPEAKKIEKPVEKKEVKDDKPLGMTFEGA